MWELVRRVRRDLGNPASGPANGSDPNNASHVGKSQVGSGSAPPTPPLSQPGRSRFQLEPLNLGHVLQLALAVAIGLGILRLVRVAGGDTRLAITILSESGYIAPIFAIFIGLFPAAIFFSIVYFLEYRGAVSEINRAAGRPGPALAGWPLIVTSWLLVLLLNYAVWYLFVGGVVMGILYIAADHQWRKEGRKSGTQLGIEEFRRTRRIQIGVAAAAAITPLIIVQATSDSPWQASELVTTKDGTKYHGVVLKRDDAWFAMLIDKPRTISYIKTDDVEKRDVCRSRVDDRTFGEFIGSAKSAGGVECPK
jgi:hypothetical protein